MDEIALNKTKAVYQEPREIPKFISPKELDFCIDFFDREPVYQPATNPRATRKDFLMFDNPTTVIQDIFYPKLHALFPGKQIVIDGGNFTEWHQPTLVHTDGYQPEYQTHKTANSSTVGFTVIVPLKTDTGQGNPYTVMFDQLIFGEQCMSNNIKDPDSVKNYTYKPFDKNCDDYKLINYHPDEYLYGLSIKEKFPWNYGSAIMWHRSQFHCATNFVGFNSKSHLLFLINFKE